jgi:hypothetical protein
MIIFEINLYTIHHKYNAPTKETNNHSKKLLVKNYVSLNHSSLLSPFAILISVIIFISNCSVVLVSFGVAGPCIQTMVERVEKRAKEVKLSPYHCA